RRAAADAQRLRAGQPPQPRRRVPHARVRRAGQQRRRQRQRRRRSAGRAAAARAVRGAAAAWYGQRPQYGGSGRRRWGPGTRQQRLERGCGGGGPAGGRVCRVGVGGGPTEVRRGRRRAPRRRFRLGRGATQPAGRGGFCGGPCARAPCKQRRRRRQQRRRQRGGSAAVRAVLAAAAGGRPGAVARRDGRARGGRGHCNGVAYWCKLAVL
ncbi:hypothetical protein MNEG_10220, partial [Monoraphidium neglectum]